MTYTAQRVERHLGFPFRGCKSTVDRHEVPLGMLGAESRELLTEPGRTKELGKAKRRHGAAGIGSATGVLEMPIADATMRSLAAFAMPSLIPADGFPVPAFIWADESKRYGQMWLKDGASDYTEGEEFGATHYPVTANGLPHLIGPAVPYDGNGATGYARWAFEENRRRMVAGSRRRAGFRGRDYYGGFLSSPTNHNRGYNTAAGAGTNRQRRLPTGLIPPLYPSVNATGSYPAKHAAVGPWQEGDTYFYAWAFEDESGCVSMPMIPRDVQTAGDLPNGLGIFTVLDAGTAQYYDYTAESSVPIGPNGTRKRRKYRSAKVSKVALTAGQYPSSDLSTFKLCGIIEDNTTTTFKDYRGSDIALLSDPLLRIDQVWQQRSRYDSAFDQRHLAGYLRPCPDAIIIAPTAPNGGTTRSINFSDDDASLVGANAYFVQLFQDSADVLVLRLRSVAMGGGAPATTAIALAGLTLQQVCDKISATTTASTGGEFAAQIVPGAAREALASNLAPTHIDRAGGTWLINSTLLTITNATHVAEGMKVNDPKWPANTYVKSKSGNILTMSAQSTVAQAVAADVEFYADTGDDACFTDATAHSQFGNYRCWANCIPAILAWKQSYLDTFPTEKRDFMVTTSGPTQKPNAPHMFHTSPGGRYSAESDAGIFMGAAALRAGTAAFYSNWCGYWVNRTTGTVGADELYRMEWPDKGHGCKSPYSIVHGNGWVGCWRDDGFWIYDGEQSAVISLDHFAVTTLGGVGEFAYEAGLCNAAAASDTNDYYMHAEYFDGRLWLNYRVSAGVFATSCYDASTSVERSGIAQMLDDNGEPFGWSPRCSYSWRSFAAGCGGAITSVRKSDGIHLYQGDDKNDKTNCGLVQEFETTGAYVDGADPVQWTLFGPCDMPGGLKKSAVAEQLTFLYKNTVASGATGVTVTLYRDQARTKSVTFTLDLTTGSDFFSRKPKNPPIACRAPAEVCEVKITGGALAAERIFEISGIEIPANVLASVT
jgi:hypothetical protein